MSVDTYVPRAGRSVRPPDLERDEREAMRAGLRAGGRPRDGTVSRWRKRGELPLLVLGALVLAFLIKTFLVQAFYIPSASMVPALEVGDRVLVEKVSYQLRDPRRGEVVVFERPGVERQGGLGSAVRSFLEGLGLLQPDADIDLIKRVIGLPGETVEVREGTVLVDGAALPEPHVAPDGRSFPAVTIPEDRYYLLGDNRGNSDDSRYTLGTVPRAAVVGRAFVVMWPPGNVNIPLRTDYAGVAPTPGDRSAVVDWLHTARVTPATSRRPYRHEPH